MLPCVWKEWGQGLTYSPVLPRPTKSPEIRVHFFTRRFLYTFNLFITRSGGPELTGGTGIYGRKLWLELWKHAMRLKLPISLQAGFPSDLSWFGVEVHQPCRNSERTAISDAAISYLNLRMMSLIQGSHEIPSPLYVFQLISRTEEVRKIRQSWVEYLRTPFATVGLTSPKSTVVHVNLYGSFMLIAIPWLELRN